MFTQRSVDQALVIAAACRINLILEPSQKVVVDPNRNAGLTLDRGYYRPRAYPYEGAVVDPELRVHGIGSLGVVEAAVMQSIVSANTQATSIAISERDANMIAANRTG